MIWNFKPCVTLGGIELFTFISYLGTEATKHSSDANDIINSFDAIVYGGILGEVLVSLTIKLTFYIVI